MASILPEPVKRSVSVWVVVAVVGLVLIGANAHLAYVAFSSQPDCVVHLKDKGEAPGKFRAAKSAC
ncbi:MULTISPECIES: hypothetical protein [unclassified Rhizobium]|uniref:hypothetical protein n=1 Tax=unclassified Rhizobium TaxID=2613769 RepID=UPI001357FA24|nr:MULTISPECIES: hypothetical protein [unclassified Rhizobium]